MAESQHTVVSTEKAKQQWLAKIWYCEVAEKQLDITGHERVLKVWEAPGK